MTANSSFSIRSLATGLCALAGLAAGANAQTFNIDFDALGFGGPTASTYAAAGTAGTWNQLNAGLGPIFNLVDKSGAATGVTLDTGPQMTFPFGFTNATMTGEDANLMNDLVWSSGQLGGTMTISGLANGTYDVYTYAMAPDSKPNGLTSINIPQSTDGAQTVGGVLWNGHAHLASYAKHTAVVTNGTLNIVVAIVGTFGESVNGIQIETAAPDNSGAAGCDCSGGGNTSCFTVSAPGSGCPNTAGGGAVLTGSGNAQVSSDTFSLSVIGGAPNNFGLILSGTASIGPIYTVPNSAGGLCSGGSTLRSDVYQLSASGTVTMPTFDSAIGAGKYGAAAGVGFETYQFWYRDPGGAAGCTTDVAGSDFNFSNGWDVTWL